MTDLTLPADTRAKLLFEATAAHYQLRNQPSVEVNAREALRGLCAICDALLALPEAREAEERSVHGITWVVIRDGCVVLEKCPKKARKLGIGEWFIPGGKIEGTETAVAALFREVREEWPGCDIDRATPLPVLEGSPVNVAPPQGPFLMRPFLVEVSGEIPDVTSEGIPLRWVSIEEALRSPVPQVRMMVAAATSAAGSGEAPGDPRTTPNRSAVPPTPPEAARVETELPYPAVSLSAPDGRAMEWQVPLWDAIHEWASKPVSMRLKPAAKVSAAVHHAMRLAIDTHDAALRAEVGHYRAKAEAYGGIVHGCSPALAAAGFPVDATKPDGAVGGIRRAVEALTAQLAVARAVANDTAAREGWVEGVVRRGAYETDDDVTITDYVVPISGLFPVNTRVHVRRVPEEET